MKPFIEKLIADDDQSFVARTFRTPHFEVPWHQHPEIEIIFFLEGEGNAFVGNHVGNFSAGDSYLLGPNLPHTFQKSDPQQQTAALVLQFLPDCWGTQFLQLPEARSLRNLIDASRRGLKMSPACSERLAPQLQSIENATGITRIILLLQCLHTMAGDQHPQQLSTKKMAETPGKQQERIDRIFQYTIDHYADSISLPAIAEYTGLSVPAFCQYFRKSTKKTYIEFLNEVRIGKACQQLIDTGKPITDIAYESGYNTLANFNKQFMKLKAMSPRQFRTHFSESRKMASVMQASTKRLLTQ